VPRTGYRANALNLISYDRISADGDGDQHGVESQARQNERSAAAHGGRIAARFVDPDVSASDSGIYREGFEALIKALLLGHLEDGTPIHGLCVVEQSRLARNSTDWERWEKAFCSKPDRIFIVDGKRIDPYADDFVVVGGVQNLMDKMEVRKIKRRTRESHEHRALTGTPVGGTRPFGWLPDRLTLDADESPWIGTIALALLDGEPVGAICRHLADHDVKTPAGNDWSPHALKQMMQNPRLVGHRRYKGGELVRDTEGAPVLGLWEPALDQNIFDSVGAVLAARKQLNVPAQRERRYLLTGLLRCGICQTRLRAMPRSDVRGGYLYQCDKHVGGCGKVARNGTKVDEFVVAAFLARNSGATPDFVATPFPQQSKLDKLTDGRTRLIAEWRADRISNDVYFSQLPDLEAQIRKLAAAREQHAAAMSLAASIPSNVAEEWAAHDNVAWRSRVLAADLHAVMLAPVGKGRRDYTAATITPLWR
jgi:DNA invertase Pin-like site-specific DNA recombinase